MRRKPAIYLDYGGRREIDSTGAAKYVGEGCCDSVSAASAGHR